MISTCVIGANWAYCWGQGSYGELGNGGTANSLVPVAVSQGAIPVGARLGNISVGGNHTCAIGDGDIGVHCWGYNNTGQLGDGSNTQSLTPVFVLTGASSVIKQVCISSGSNHTCSVNYNGQAYCWGQGTYGKLGNDSTTNTPTMSYVLLKGLTPTIDFDTTPATSTTETPVYEGGMSAEIEFEEVVSTAATTEEALGSLAGRGKLQRISSYNEK